MNQTSANFTSNPSNAQSYGLQLPDGLMARSVHDSADAVLIWKDQASCSVERKALPSPNSGEAIPGVVYGGLTINSLARYSALVQYNPFWIRPSVGSTETQLAAISEQIYSLLWQDHDQQYHVALPLAGARYRAYLLGDGVRGLGLHVEMDAVAQTGPLMVVAKGSDPYSVMHNAVAAASRALGFRLRPDKPLPAFVDMLGWCTWDAFYHKVDESKLIEGLESFVKGGLVPPLLILDDGWLNVDDKQRLSSFEPNAEKFPDGLGPMISRIKQHYGVRLFGIWHTLGGYWQGVNPDSALGERYHVQQSAVPLRRADGSVMNHAFAVSPEDIARFYHDFYSYLKQCGVDLTKVDNHNAQANYAPDSDRRGEMVARYQQAFQGAAWTHMMGNAIHCMCNRNDVAYHMSATTVWRNSDDYFPERDGSHQCHVVYNAMNNLWSSQFALPDWDMFWSGRDHSAFHAAARAISGGPVYFSDRPNEQDFQLLNKLCISNGRVLRCAQPALPAEDCLFVDYQQEHRFLKITNHNNKVGVLGLFHCLWAENPDDRQAITDSFRASDMPGLQGQRVACYQHHAQTLHIGDMHEKHTLTLGFREHEIVTLVPMDQGVGMLGLLDKFNGSAAITRETWFDDNQVQWELSDGGRIGLAVQRPIASAWLNGKPIELMQVQDTCLWTIDAPLGQGVEVSLIFSN